MDVGRFAGLSDMTPGLTSPAEIHGFVASGFEPVAEEFERNFSERGEIGAAFAAHVDGNPVVDLWGGLANLGRAESWQQDTLVGIFSGTKGIVAACLALLLDRGQLDLDTPVCTYWPEFAAHGKDGILVRDVVSHQAGLPGIATPISVDEATNHLRMAELVAAERPLHPPGAGPHYHPLTFGWICGELVRRIDGRSIGSFLQAEIAEPLGLEIWIGLPVSCESRVALLEAHPEFAAEARQLTADDDPITWSIFANPPRFDQHALAANLRSWHGAEIPGTNGIVAARSLSRLYGCLAGNGEIEGVRLMSPETIDFVRRPLSSGLDGSLRLAFGVGFEVQTSNHQLGPPPDAFGHEGAGGSVHGAWPTEKAGFSYTPNLLGPLANNDPRAEALLQALHRVLSRG